MQQLFRDPRPDLNELGHDSELWVQLLQLANEADSKLAGILHGFRCQGTILRKNPRWGYVLQPVINSKIGWSSQDDYNRQRAKWLDPYRQDIIKILGALARDGKVQKEEQERKEAQERKKEEPAKLEQAQLFV